MGFYKQGYEAGASAMLEAIRRRGIHGKINHMEGSWSPGTHVFIPDDEVKA
jgi:hypothetical protein